MSLTVGTVTRLCASKPPGLRNRMGSGTSKRVPRRLVVWGTRVTSARSVSSIGTLRTSAGRTFAVRPKSTSQTSPRSGEFTAVLRRDPARGILHQPGRAVLRPRGKGAPLVRCAEESPAPPLGAPAPGASRTCQEAFWPSQSWHHTGTSKPAASSMPIGSTHYDFRVERLTPGSPRGFAYARPEPPPVLGIYNERDRRSAMDKSSRTLTSVSTSTKTRISI